MQFQPAVDYDALRSELHAVEGRIADLRRQRPGIGGPIALTAVGGGIAFVGLYAAMLTWATSEGDTRVRSDGYDTEYDDTDDDSDGRVLGSMLGIAAVGIGMSVGGIVWLSNRLHQRKESKPEMDALKQRRKVLLQGLRYGFHSDGQNHVVMLQGAL